MKENILIPIVKSLKDNNKQLSKVTNFVKNCDYFKGRRRKAYTLIIKYKNKRGDK